MVLEYVRHTAVFILLGTLISQTDIYMAHLLTSFMFYFKYLASVKPVLRLSTSNFSLLLSSICSFLVVLFIYTLVLHAFSK